ncbi:MAG: DUF362 domain-containing protein [Myxococcota bacterium]|nr:DUF362 domain-containing protein [Myxococcota bacterium]
MTKPQHTSASPPARVSAVRLDTYEPDAVDRAIRAALEPFGGIGAFIQPARDVVLKPNFLAPRHVNKAVTTHPEIIRGVARLTRSACANPILVTDSPAIGSASGCAKRLGLSDPSLFEVVNADDGVEVSFPEAHFHRLRLSARVANAGTLINIAKAKTHAKTGITAAVKNSFGAVVGMEKVQWHFRIGPDPRHFARLLVHIHQTVRPSLNILDAVVGMEGNGPNSGDPRHLGFILASPNAHALDGILCRILGIGPKEILTLAVAQEIGALGSIDDIEVIGENIEDLRPSTPWRMARMSPINRIVESRWMGNVLDRTLTLRPLVDPKKCTACGICASICIAKAITVDKQATKPKKKTVIDKKQCISCFCCQEICPEGAITASPGAIARMLRLGTRQ